MNNITSVTEKKPSLNSHLSFKIQKFKILK